MQMTQLIGKLGRSDVKLIGRDSFLIFMFLFAAIIAAVLRFGLPALNTYLAENGVMPGNHSPQPGRSLSDAGGLPGDVYGRAVGRHSFWLCPAR